MDVLADRGAFGDRSDHRLAEVFRVRAREADPLDPLDGVAGAKELAELRPDVRREVAAPRVDVLAEQRELLDALTGEAGHLGDHLSRAAAALAPAHGGDDAVRADRVAAHRDLHPGLKRPFSVHRQGRGELAVVEPEAPTRHPHPTRAEPLAEVGDRAGAEGDVDVGIELEDPLALSLGEAAADGDHALGITSLACRCVAEISRELRVGLLADRACVEDDHVGLLGARSLAEAELLEHSLDPLRIVGVHLAPEGRDVVAPHCRRVAAAGRAPPRVVR